MLRESACTFSYVLSQPLFKPVAAIDLSSLCHCSLLTSFQQGHGNKSTFAYRSSSSTRVSHAMYSERCLHKIVSTSTMINA